MYIAGLIKYASSLSTGTLSRVLQSREYSAYNTYSTRVRVYPSIYPSVIGGIYKGYSELGFFNFFFFTAFLQRELRFFFFF